jgi:hypothetical protein
MRREAYMVGNVLCDMHDGFRFLPDNLEVVSHIRWYDGKATEKVTALAGKHPGNKFLVVVGETVAYDGNIVAAYSYDGSRMGVVELRLKQA